MLRAHDPDEVLLLQDGKRQRVPRRHIRSITTVQDLQRDFFKHRANAVDIAMREWMLVDWAVSRGLDRMARLQALHVLLEDGDHERAHEFLGHRRKGDEWLWPLDSQWVSRATFETHVSDWGHPLILEGEHFRVRTNAGLRVGVDALFDLERLYVWWFDALGDALRPRPRLG